jgi:hypothetical protein
MKTKAEELHEDRKPLVMCASCWRVQVPEDELAFDPDEWVNPTTFMAQADGGAGDYLIMDGCCHMCLTEILCQIQSMKHKTAHERLNA